MYGCELLEEEEEMEEEVGEGGIRSSGSTELGLGPCRAMLFLIWSWIDQLGLAWLIGILFSGREAEESEFPGEEGSR